MRCHRARHRARIGIAELSRIRPDGRYARSVAGCISIASSATTWYHGSPTIDLRRRAERGVRIEGSQLRLTLVLARHQSEVLNAASNAGRERMSQTTISVSPITPRRSAAPASSAARTHRSVRRAGCARR